MEPGGPGGSGFRYAVYRSVFLPAEITRRFDVIGFDPRGVGLASPVKCFSDADLDTSFAAEPDPVSDAAFNDIVQLTKDASASCGTKYGDKLPLFSTEQAARDTRLLTAIASKAIAGAPVPGTDFSATA